MLHGAKWMFWSYVNGHSPDEQDKNKAACLAVTHSYMALRRSLDNLRKTALSLKTNKQIACKYTLESYHKAQLPDENLT